MGSYPKWEGDKFVFQGIWARGAFQIIGWTVLEAEPEDNKHMRRTYSFLAWRQEET